MSKKALLILFFGFFLQKISVAQLPGFTLTGNPKAVTGATWTFKDSVDGVWYDLQGILFQPPSGNAPYPAVIINHGTGGNVNGYSKSVSLKMVQWNFVCIATNLCHSAGVPIGSPGDTNFANLGASTNNYLRDMMCRKILASLNYVDTNCVMAFGHSRGAYLTTGLVATYPGKFICAGHTAGGATALTGYSAPSTALAAQVTCPYIIHHGDSDNTVPVRMDSTLNSVFDTTGVVHQFYVYHTYTHSQMSMDSLMFVRTHDWFVNHSCLASSTDNVPGESQSEISVYPNPVQSTFTVELQDRNFDLEISDIAGRCIYSLQNIFGKTRIDFRNIPAGIYLAHVLSESTIFNKRIIVVH